MQEIISWCNNNDGFLTAILAIFSLVISVIAVYVSITTARLPYQKKIKITCARYFIAPYGESGINICATNIGQTPVCISMMGLRIAGSQYTQPKRLTDCQKVILRSEKAEIMLELYDLQQKLRMQKLGGAEKIYAFMRDSEGMTHKIYYATVRELLSFTA